MPKLVFILSLLLLGACYAQPTDADLNRVMDDFMILRFQAPMRTEYANLTDRQLFELSCKNKRVKCDAVMNLLKTKDAAFYAKLTENER